MNIDCIFTVIMKISETPFVRKVNLCIPGYKCAGYIALRCQGRIIRFITDILYSNIHN